jgi:fibronectin-binding autotransporter adhesin
MTTISSSSTIGIVLSSPGYTNPVVVNPGITVSSGGNGVSATAESWTIENGGSIVGNTTSAAYSGIALAAGGSVTNLSSASITESTGIFGGGGEPMTVVNAGSIAGKGTTGFGVFLNSGGSVTNAASASITGILNRASLLILGLSKVWGDTYAGDMTGPIVAGEEIALG